MIDDLIIFSPGLFYTVIMKSTDGFKILLLEGVSQTAVDLLNTRYPGLFEIEYHKKALQENELIEKIKHVDAVGIRSKTKLTANVLSHAKNLKLIACFCIGTNQVDLEYATNNGIVVFNSPFSNSRSVGIDHPFI